MINRLKRKLIEWLELDNLVTSEELTSKEKLWRNRWDGIESRVDRKLHQIEDMTRVDVDPSMGRGNNTIVFTGVYKGKGYVRFYDVGGKEFEELVNILKSMKRDKYLIRHIDEPYGIGNFKGMFDLD